jgi:hypothetical protein
VFIVILLPLFRHLSPLLFLLWVNLLGRPQLCKLVMHRVLVLEHFRFVLVQLLLGVLGLFVDLTL